MSIKSKVSGFLSGMVLKLGEDVVMKLAREFLTEENIKGAIDAVLDKLEDLIEKSPTKVDDRLLLPPIKKLREGLNIPDND